jgi:hypothetical protein
VSSLISSCKLPIPLPNTDINDGKAAGTGALVWAGIALERDNGIDFLFVEREMRWQAILGDLTHTISPSLRFRVGQYS